MQPEMYLQEQQARLDAEMAGVMASFTTEQGQMQVTQQPTLQSALESPALITMTIDTEMKSGKKVTKVSEQKVDTQPEYIAEVVDTPMEGRTVQRRVSVTVDNATVGEKTIQEIMEQVTNLSSEQVSDIFKETTETTTPKNVEVTLHSATAEEKPETKVIEQVKQKKPEKRKSIPKIPEE